MTTKSQVSEVEQAATEYLAAHTRYAAAAKEWRQMLRDAESRRTGAPRTLRENWNRRFRAVMTRMDQAHVEVDAAEAEIERCGGWVDVFCDEGDMRVYGPGRRILARF